MYAPVVYLENELGENIGTVAVILETGQNRTCREQQLV
jgi:hypothetical protein